MSNHIWYGCVFYIMKTNLSRFVRSENFVVHLVAVDSPDDRTKLLNYAKLFAER